MAGTDSGFEAFKDDSAEAPRGLRGNISHGRYYRDRDPPARSNAGAVRAGIPLGPDPADPSPKAAPARMRRFFIAVLVLACLAGAAAYGWLDYRYQRQPLAFAQSPARIEVRAGMGLRQVGGALRAAGADAPDWLLQAAARLRDDDHRLQVGTYAVEEPQTLRQLLDRMVAGDVLMASITIIEGWRFAQMRQAIDVHPEVRREGADGVEPAEVLQRLGIGHDHPEGLFFPSTYRFPVGTTDLGVYRMAHDAMTRLLERAWASRDPDLPLATPYEALILASVVEKETGIEADRRVIAGVFINRLRRGMMLQSDPTTIYGLGDAFDGDLRRVHLRTDTPYNTYTRKGLPPTPIALPGLASIEAVLHPASTDALYFVARGDGSSHFSSTLAEHNAAVRRYQLGQRP